MIRRLCFLAILAAMSVTPALATPVFTWSFNQLTYTEGSSGLIDVVTTITNTGTTNITGFHGGIGFDSGTFFPFETGQFFPSQSSVFPSTGLAPGHSVTWDFIDIAFRGATPGTYSLFYDAGLTLVDSTGATSALRLTSGLPTVDVVPEVPEPSGLVLVGTGVLGLLEMARRRLPVWITSR
jgi:hypothetical protein